MKGIRLRFAPYAVALLAVSIALLLTLLLQPLLNPTVFLLFFAAVAVSAWYGGMEVGILAIILSTLAVNYFFIQPVFSLVVDLSSLVRLTLFMLVTFLMSLLTSELRTARQRLEVSTQKQQASEARFRRLAESNVIGIIVAEINGAIVEANNAFLEMVGYTREDMLAGRMQWHEMTPSEYIEESKSAIAKLKATGVCTAFEKEYICKNGSRVPVLIGSALLENNQQQVISFVLNLSDRRQIENAWRESQSRFRALADATIEGVIIHENGKVLDANPAVAKMFGYELNEIIGMSATELLTPGSQKIFIENFRSSDDKPYELIGVKKDGTVFFLEVVGKNCIYQGRTVRVATGRDITEHKRIEEALRQREDELRLITDAVPVLISYVDTEQRYRFNNKGYEDWHGLCACETYGKHVQELLGESVYQSILPYIEMVLSGEQVIFETQVPHKNGKIRDVSTTYIPQFGQQGTVQGFVALVTDITNHKLAQKALKDSEERLRTLTEKVRVIPWEVDATTGNFTYVGPQTVEILGYPFTDWYADNFWAEHMHPEDQEWAIDYCLEASLSQDNYEFEYRMLAADGRIVWLYDIVNVVRSGNQPQLLHGFMIDITDRKFSEQEREQLLAREQAARAEAEAANRMKDEFLATLSHELRTPLNAMLGWTHLLKNRKFDETTTERALETIDRNTKSLAQLIEDVLDVSRIIRGTLHLNTQPVELISIVQAAIDTVRPAADAREIRIECKFDPTVGVVMGDGNRLQQVVWNLLSNAVKFTAKEGIVTLQLERINSRVQIRVSDTGGGIAPEFLPHVFERFRQADSSTTRSHGGLGLGLAIVRHLVELHGGTVSAESPGIGQGATFIVNLPMKAVAINVKQPEQLASVNPDCEDPNSLPTLNGLRVLVVDDEPDARQLIATVLGQYGAQVMAVASAFEALLAVPQFHPDILVSDIGMPQEDGYALIRQLRTLSQEQGGRIPAVALTAYARTEDRTQALLAGFQLHVPKPVNPTELAAVVANLAGRT
ncbi:hybrid sensor histidine kinase/response regulator [Halotia branconii]|uniref:Circadian input-output histidine kinase CikA n=1 Tax=Halotia branconii CENA392 TaxID=1539056 RepID=A0AAJ6NQ73_9CYAN|nr:PAS domain S-box protein [Halotia branconii]WGV24694.1 PAS domain S-box protein [Halotia branconii CENA392]